MDGWVNGIRGVNEWDRGMTEVGERGEDEREDACACVSVKEVVEWVRGRVGVHRIAGAKEGRWHTANFQHSEQFLFDRLFGSAARARRQLARVIFANLLVAVLEKENRVSGSGG